MRTFQVNTVIQRHPTFGVVPRAGVEPARPCGHYALNVARLPFRHLGNPQFDGNPQHSRYHTLPLAERESEPAPDLIREWGRAAFNLTAIQCDKHLIRHVMQRAF